MFTQLKQHRPYSPPGSPGIKLAGWWEVKVQGTGQGSSCRISALACGHCQTQEWGQTLLSFPHHSLPLVKGQMPEWLRGEGLHSVRMPSC